MAEMTAVTEEDMIWVATGAEMESCGGFQRGQNSGDRGSFGTSNMDFRVGPERTKGAINRKFWKGSSSCSQCYLCYFVNFQFRVAHGVCVCMSNYSNCNHSGSH